MRQSSVEMDRSREHFPKQAIKTKYIPPSNSRGARIRASCSTKTKTIVFDFTFDHIANHEQAARILAQSLGWNECLIGALYQNDFYWIQNDSTERL